MHAGSSRGRGLGLAIPTHLPCFAVLSSGACPIDGRRAGTPSRAIMVALNQNAPPIWSPPLRRPAGRATGTARFQEIQKIDLGDANAIHHPHVPQVTTSTERIDATSRYSETLGHVANPQEGSRCLL